MFILKLALKSLLNRKFTVALTIFSIAVSITLLLGVERIRIGLENSFTNTISGTDLVVGARTGDEQLLLSTVFHIGMASNNISWHSYEDIAANELIDWTIPISMGDSHEGYSVIGTNDDYFTHYQFANKQHLQFQAGKAFHETFEAVLGADVAASHEYKIGDEIVINHGSGEIAFHDHADKPFHVSGILQRTGTPVDQTIHVSLEGIEAIHIDQVDGVPDKHMHFSAEEVEHLHLEPEYITAFLVGLKSRTDVLAVQRQINENKSEALTAVMPGITLQGLWNMMGKIETALLIVSGFVAIAGLIGMLVALLTGINERRREMGNSTLGWRQPVKNIRFNFQRIYRNYLVGNSIGYSICFSLAADRKAYSGNTVRHLFKSLRDIIAGNLYYRNGNNFGNSNWDHSRL